MTPATLAKEGYAAILQALVDDWVVWCHLYVNDPPLTDLTTRAELQEAAFDGYDSIPVSRWTPAALSGPLAFSNGDPCVFRWGGGGDPPTAQGHFATAGKDGPLLWAWRRPGPAYLFTPDQPLLTVTVTVTLPILIS